ncbi:MAG: four helix bundle protein [Bacteroidia bacterium]
MKRENPIRDKSFAFSIRVVNVYKYLVGEKKEFVMSKQFLRSGTAIGALYREAEQAESKADFVHKLGIAQKECNEVLYWLELLNATDFLDQDLFDSLHDDATELIKIITSIIKSTKRVNNG